MKNTTKFSERRKTAAKRKRDSEYDPADHQKGRPPCAFEIDKIASAIFGAAQASGGQDYEMARDLAGQVEKALEAAAGDEILPLSRYKIR